MNGTNRPKLYKNLYCDLHLGFHGGTTAPTLNGLPVRTPVDDAVGELVTLIRLLQHDYLEAVSILPENRPFIRKYEIISRRIESLFRNVRISTSGNMFVAIPIMEIATRTNSKSKYIVNQQRIKSVILNMISSSDDDMKDNIILKLQRIQVEYSSYAILIVRPVIRFIKQLLNDGVAEFDNEYEKRITKLMRMKGIVFNSYPISSSAKFVRLLDLDIVQQEKSYSWEL